MAYLVMESRGTLYVAVWARQDGRMLVDAVLFIICLAIGLLLDWAIYYQWVTLICSPAFYGRSDGYAAGLFPRIIVTVVSICLLFYVGTTGEKDISLFWLGTALFFASSGYAVYRFVRNN